MPLVNGLAHADGIVFEIDVFPAKREQFSTLLPEAVKCGHLGFGRNCTLQLQNGKSSLRGNLGVSLTKKP